MDLIMLIFGCLVILIGSAVGGFIAVMVVEGYGYAKLHSRIYSLEQTGRSALGVEARQDKAARMSEAAAKAVLIMKEEGEQSEKTKKLIGLAVEYPDIALDLVKKVGLKGLV